jgi:Mn-dependent DtxR family transcriptional regulator
MPYSDDLNREYTKEEARFWREVQFAAKNNPGSQPIVDIAQGMGISGQRAAQYGRTWANDGLVVVVGWNGRTITLTPFGRRFTFGGSYGDIE